MFYKQFYNQLKQINILFAFIALSHWSLSFLTDRFVFRIQDIFGEPALFVRYKIFKVVLFCMLLTVWQIIAYIIKEYKTNDNVRRWLKYSLIYFAIMMFFLLLTWPGVWRSDEMMIYESVRLLNIDYWHGFLIYKIYILFLMLLPFAAGILIVQNLIIAAIVGYVVFKIQDYFKHIKVVLILFLPFLLLPVIDNNLYPMRTTLYAYIWLLLIIKILFVNLKDKPKDIDIFIVFSLALISYLFRSEGILATLFMPAYYYFICKLNSRHYKIIFIVFYIICFFTIFFVQQTMAMQNKQKYEIYSIVTSVSNLYLKLNLTEQKKIATVVGNIIDVSEFVKGNAIDIHKANFVKNFTNQEYKEFIKLYFKLIIKYPGLYIKENFQKFVVSYDNIGRTTDLFDEESDYEGYTINSLILFNAINKNIRKRIISFIERRDMKVYNLKLPFFYMFYSPIILIFIIFFIAVVFFIFKEYNKIVVCLLLFFTTIIVVVLSPTAKFMYYFYLYPISYLLLTVVIIRLVLKFKDFSYDFKK